jgi:hypothetical protein
MLLPNTHIDKRVNCSSCGSTLLKYNLDQKSKASASPVAAEERPYEQDLVPARKKFQIRNILEQLTISRETKNSLDSRQQQSANRSATDVDKMEGDVENVLLTGAPQERTVASNDVQAPVTAKMDSRDSEIISASSVEFCVAEEFVQPMGAAITRDHLGYMFYKSLFSQFISRNRILVGFVRC